jgi:transcriptional regulator with XRE-family HTH domain
MPKTKPTAPSTPILLRARLALGMSQAAMGEVLGATRKTIARWEHPLHTFSPSETKTLAEAVYPVDPELAAEIADHGGATLESLGVVAPATPSLQRPAPSPAAPPKVPSLAHLVDAVVMAAAEAQGRLSPDLRPILYAAFERADAMGLSAGAVASALKSAAVA